MQVQFDATLVQRYDRPGPRYTSYPTAVQFHNDTGEAAYAAAMARGNERATPLSLYVHVPFCSSPCFYCGCTRVITRNQGAAETYIEYLSREIRWRGAAVDKHRVIEQLHFGGGSPTFMNQAQLGMVVDDLARNFRLSSSEDREYAVEVDPRTVDEFYVRALAAMGFNRISFGVQDLDPAVQQAVNRVQTVEQIRTVFDAARAADFTSISVDLIYGLPRQTPESFANTLRTVAAMRPDRIAVYGYAHMPQLFSAQKQIDTRLVPDPATKLRLLQIAVDELTGAGYEYLGLDHFAWPADELVKAQRQGTLTRNFQGYSTHGGADVIGLGMSAISQVGDAYVQNVKTLEAYYAAIGDGRLPIERGVTLSWDDRIRRHVIQRLMCDTVLSFAEVEARFELDFNDYFTGELAALQPMVADGLLVLEPHQLRLTPVGRLLMRNVAMVFDAYLQRPAAEGRVRHSQTV